MAKQEEVTKTYSFRYFPAKLKDRVKAEARKQTNELRGKGLPMKTMENLMVEVIAIGIEKLEADRKKSNGKK